MTRLDRDADAPPRRALTRRLPWLALALGAGALAAGAHDWSAPAPIARIRGRHRLRLLVKAPRGAPLQGAIRAWTAPLTLPGDTRLAIDIDPQSFW